jgi:sulfide:quinone oxidoreductase
MAGEQRHVLIAGGGVAALETALALRALAHEEARVELIAPEPRFWYRPLAVAEPFGLGEARSFDLGDLAARMGASFSLGELLSVDTARRLAYTSPGGAMPYATLVVACGTTPAPAVRGALTFRGPSDSARVQELLAELEAGAVRRVAFVVPAGAVWGLPAYELALMTSAWLAGRAIDAEVTLVTPETSPLQLFGREASDAVRALLETSGVTLHTGAYATEARPGELLLVGDGIVVADRVVALPRLEGPRIGGIPQTFEGFVPVDEHGRVIGVDDVYAAGDITAFSVKQGGIAAQQAEAAAESIAAEAGVDLVPRPFRPVLRGLLLTGSEPRFLHTELRGGGTSWVSGEMLWWPPAKIVGRYLSPFLAEVTGTSPPSEPPPEAGIRVEAPIDTEPTARRDRLVVAAVEDALRDSEVQRVGDVMSEHLLVAAPEDTLGEIADRMVELGVGSALIAAYGRLIGILTSRDMLHAIASRVHPSEARARQWMTAEPITVSAASSLEAAAAVMIEHDIHHLPVVDGERPVGMIGMREVVRSRRRPSPTRRSGSVSEPPTGGTRLPSRS